MKKFYRIKKDSFIGGVCTGLAELFGVKDLTWMFRVVFILFSNVSILIYLILWLLTDEK